MISDSEAQAIYLADNGWGKTDFAIRKGVRYTYWRKFGREFPQHFAAWLESKGWNGSVVKIA